MSMKRPQVFSRDQLLTDKQKEGKESGHHGRNGFLDAGKGEERRTNFWGIEHRRWTSWTEFLLKQQKRE